MADYRYDPFLGASTAVAITNELRAIPAASPYNIRLVEVPLKESPSSLTMKIRDAITAAIATVGATSCTVAHGSWFAIDDVITIDNEQMLVTNIVSNTLTITRGYNGTTAATHSQYAAVYGPAWSEVATTPAARQFWPDYSITVDGDNTWNTGTIKFNSADAGKVVAVSYKGIGTLVDEVNGEYKTGEIAFFAMNTPPAGWIKANGAAVSRAAYYKLFSAIGTTFGAGDSYSTFTVPDMRGYFPRGWDDGRGVDSGRAFGSSQADDNKAHTHTITVNTDAQVGTVAAAGWNQGTYAYPSTNSSGGTEARPKNVALLACIKY